MNKLIYDADMVKEFIKILPQPKDLDVFFVSLSCRNKYLTEAEREEYDLGRTEMFGQCIARDADKLFRNIRRFESHEEAFTTKNGKPMPNHAMVVYVNIDTSSSLKAYKEFSSKMNDNMMELASKALANQPINDTCRFINKADKILLDCYQRASDQRKFIDVDFDVPIEALPIVKTFIDNMRCNNGDGYVINTKGGFHVLLERSTVKFNYNTIIEIANEDMVAKFGKDFKYEIVVNKNNMVPVPGTVQAGHPVTFMKFERF